MKNKAPGAKRSRRSRSLIDRVNPNAAGIDCGSERHYVAVPTGRDPEPVRSFTTFTADLERLADWLVACGIKTVAMEATGVYWIPVYEILEGRGLAGRHDLAVHCRQLVDAPDDDRLRPHQLVYDEGSLARAGHVGSAADVHHHEVRAMVPAHHELLLRRDAGIAGDVSD